jgi:RimJ/RimL family protein N-acetyltransferase
MSERGGLENPEGPALQTERLLLRRGKMSDRALFGALNSGPVVIEHVPSRASPEESDQMVDRMEAEFGARGFELWALERRDDGEFIGFTGLHHVHFQAPFTPTGGGLANERCRRHVLHRITRHQWRSN